LVRLVQMHQGLRERCAVKDSVHLNKAKEWGKGL